MSKNKILNVGICGLGRIGRFGHGDEIALFPEYYNIAACADTEPSRLENLPVSFKNARKYNSLDEMLKDASLDVITIGTRHLDHVPMALKILEAGKIAVVEKPVATSLSEFRILRSAAEKNPNRVFLRHNRRFEPAFTKARELVRSGMLGEISYVKLFRSVGYQRRNDWMTMTEFYGGLLSNWGPHIIDHALQLLDSPVVDIWADVRHCICIGDGDDQMKIILKGANGRVADVEITGANTLTGREMEIVGTRGTLIYDGGQKIHVRMVDPSIPFVPLKPHSENPPLAYGNFEEKLTFVDMDYDLAPIAMSDIWKHIYLSAVQEKTYPITWDEAESVVWVTEEAFRRSGFNPMISRQNPDGSFQR